MQIYNEGTIYIIVPETDDEQNWVETYLDKARVIIEHRYIADIVEGMVADGIEIERK
jgi:hypothetical protein